ncbi:MAG TPA: Gmad2 immunoglobulin-like domain-containing protein, partial [Actinomycetota bacterium]|nr:Gmad2 immunoglobulin-like domain-containing protein [Actinomycetota bacterium]
AADGKPAIVVRTPAPGDVIVSPVQITGTAMVFEGTVSVAVVDARGVPLASTFTTASCGSGCRGRYFVELAFIVERRQAATIQVFEVSAEGGNAINVASVPVTLSPGG